ncbi:PilW family protein (plasmid) [Legionella sp. D16C41]|uniref:PilW family protein n=1 Tax=Legionella sp. D16C41 TaxID=3402688 RepID=UPI003AF8C94F
MTQKYRGVTLVEFLISIAIGLLIITIVLSVYLAQTQFYKVGVAQATMQNAENAIAEIITPYIRSAGFAGCATFMRTYSALNPISSPPLSVLNTTPRIITGYTATPAISPINAANDSAANHWSPSLDSGLVGNVKSGSDVIVLLGGVLNKQPVGVTAITNGSASFTVQTSSGITAGQLGVISDCAKATLFAITGVSGNQISHAASGGNASASFNVSYPVGSQFLPVQQTAFFVGLGEGNQSALKMGTFNGTTWTIQSLIPNVDTLKVSYGVGDNGVIQQYVSANNVVNWDKVYAVRLGFILSGQVASGSTNGNPTQFTLLGQTVTIPADNRLRHTFEIMIYMRNATI